MRVVMYVQNDVVRDSRVLREASTLAEAGHVVTILGRASSARTAVPSPRDGVEVRLLSVPVRRPLWFTWLAHPASLWPLVVRDARGGPATWPRGFVAFFAALAGLPWALARGAWARARPAGRGRGPLDYLARWRFGSLPWARAAAAAAPVADVHHAHDLEALPAALAAARRDGGRVVYDAHEVTLAWDVHAAQPRPVRAFMAAWERRLVRRVDGMVTVNDGCAEELVRRLAPRRIAVVRNCPPRWTGPATAPGPLRAAAGVAPGVPLVLCHGGFQANRGLEQTAEAMTLPGLEDAVLVFLGYAVHAANPIVTRILADQRLAGRVVVLDAVPPDVLLDWVAGADVGVMPIQPTDLNHVLSTPNKLFECIAAGVPVVSSDFPERRSIVLGGPWGPLGAVCDPTDPAAIATAIRSILSLDPSAREELRARCRRAARERWNWETEATALLDLYAGLSA
jgi:glycosyltransferase involved in cell wall biosynthesis